MEASLPERANLDWLRKTAKQRLRSMRVDNPQARLADAQLAIAREFGFSSWRTLRAHVEGLRRADNQNADSAIARLLRAVAAGAIEEVRDVLAAAPELINARGPHPYWGGSPQPLHVAIESGRIEMVAFILGQGADPNGDNSSYDHWSPLMLAAEKPAIREMLLRHGARVGLVEALMMGDDPLSAELLAQGKLPSIVPNNGSILAFARTTFAIEHLVALGASTTAEDRWGVRPVEALSRLGASGMPLVRLLIELGAAVTAGEYARMGDGTTLEAMIANDPSIVRDERVLMAAIGGRHLRIAELLLKRGATPNARSSDKSRQSALHSAAWNGDLEMLRLLLESGADPTLRDDEYDETPLGWAEMSVKVTGNAGLDEVIAVLRSAAAEGR